MLVIAHRGSSQVTPENTLLAVKKAMRDGADAIEVDVQLTQDNKLIICHDEWLNRTTTGTGFIYDKTWAEIEKLDAGSWFHAKFKGTKIPLLEEVLEEVKGSSIQLNIELKNNLIPYPGMEAEVIQLIRKHAMEEQVLISSFRRNSLELCQHVAPEIRRGFLCWSTIEPLIQYEEWNYLGLYSVHPHIFLVNERIKALQEKGLKIYPYVVEKKQQLLTCQKHQVDGIFTNSPGRVKQILKRS